MKIQIAILILLSTSLWARSHADPVKLADASDPGYMSALAAANHFLHTWQVGDVENGMILLSDSIRRSQNAVKVEHYFSTAGARAFEITRGHGHQGLYTFPVVLFVTQDEHVSRKFAEITLVESGKNDWVVDKLP